MPLRVTMIAGRSAATIKRVELGLPATGHPRIADLADRRTRVRLAERLMDWADCEPIILLGLELLDREAVGSVAQAMLYAHRGWKQTRTRQIYLAVPDSALEACYAYRQLAPPGRMVTVCAQTANEMTALLAAVAAELGYTGLKIPMPPLKDPAVDVVAWVQAARWGANSTDPARDASPLHAARCLNAGNPAGVAHARDRLHKLMMRDDAVCDLCQAAAVSSHIAQYGHPRYRDTAGWADELVMGIWGAIQPESSRNWQLGAALAGRHRHGALSQYGSGGTGWYESQITEARQRAKAAKAAPAAKPRRKATVNRAVEATIASLEASAGSTATRATYAESLAAVARVHTLTMTKAARDPQLCLWACEVNRLDLHDSPPEALRPYRDAVLESRRARRADAQAPPAPARGASCGVPCTAQPP